MMSFAKTNTVVEQEDPYKKSKIAALLYRISCKGDTSKSQLFKLMSFFSEYYHMCRGEKTVLYEWMGR